MLRKNFYWLFFYSLLFSSCVKDKTYVDFEADTTFNLSIYEYLEARPTVFDSVIFVLNKSGLSDLLKNNEEHTFFAPTNRSLEAAMTGLNLYRRSRQLEQVSLKDIDSSSWRVIMGNYIVGGKWAVNDFAGQDGKRVKTVANRWMYGNITPVSASGAAGIAGTTLTFTYNNGSRFTKDWLPALVTTSEIGVNNGYIHILEAGHSVGYTYFIDKTSAVQNLYSDSRAFSFGNAYHPNFQVEAWANRIKNLVAKGENKVETEAAQQGDIELKMLLTIQPNDSIDIVQSPGVTSGIIERNGPCYFDRENLTFILNYQYKTTGAFVPVNERITYTAD